MRVIYRIFVVMCCILILSCGKKESITKESIDKSVEHLQKAVEWNNKRAKIVNNDSSLKISKGDITLIKEYLNNAIEEAKQVDTIVLNSVKSNYGHVYYYNYIKGMEIELQGIEEGDVDKSILGQLKYDEYLSWLEKNGL